MSTLGRVLDPEELDDAEGPRGKLAVDVPQEWMAAGDAIEIVIPRRVACARCDGGGCDECSRSGALRIEGDDDARTVRLSLPEEPAAVRLVRPLGEDANLEQLVVELRACPEASAYVRRVPSELPLVVVRRAPTPLGTASATVAIVIALAVMVAAFLSMR